MKLVVPKIDAAPAPAPERAGTAFTGGAPPLCSSQLFRGARELQIRHGGDIYRLSITGSGKLILTK